MNLLKTKLGFDEAFNYKEEVDFNAALERFGFYINCLINEVVGFKHTST